MLDIHSKQHVLKRHSISTDVIRNEEHLQSSCVMFLGLLLCGLEDKRIAHSLQYKLEVCSLKEAFTKK